MLNENQSTKPYASAIAILRQQIKANAEKGSAIRAEITRLRGQPDTGPERHALWQDKRAIGLETRHLLLAYGILRGRSYVSIEPRSRTEPSAFDVRTHILRALGFEPHPYNSTQYSTTERTEGQVPPEAFTVSNLQKLFKREEPKPVAVEAPVAAA